MKKVLCALSRWSEGGGGRNAIDRDLDTSDFTRDVLRDAFEVLVRMT